MGLGDIIWAGDIMISFCAYVISDIMVLDWQMISLAVRYCSSREAREMAAYWTSVRV